MATNTENLNLKKPAQEDFYNVDDFSENFQKIDDFAGRKDNPHNVTKEQLGLGNVDNTSDANKPVSTAQALAIADAKAVGTTAQSNITSHTSNKDNPHSVTKAQVGLGNVDNTADVNKPISTKQAEAIAEAKSVGTTAQTNITNHMNNQNNPHIVTKSQVGLGNVPNIATNDQTPTYTEASILANLTSGEKLSVAFGKIKKAITDFISHLADTTKHITSTERTTWNTITEVRKKAEAAGFKLLKTQAISTGNFGDVGYSYIPVTGVDVFSYDELRLIFKGTITYKMTNTEYSYGGVTTMLGFDSIATSMRNDYYSNITADKFPPNAERTTDISCETEITSLGYYAKSITSDGTVTFTADTKKVKTMRTPGTYATKGTDGWSNNAIYFNAYNSSTGVFDVRISGNVYVFGKEKLI